MPHDGFLHRYFLANGGKPLHKWTHYFDIYERHFERFRDRRPAVLEIGVQGGGSLAMWKAYFGEGAAIVGLDIEAECKQHEAPGIEIFIGSQDDKAVIAAILANYPAFDIVIDDGSHLCSHMIATFELLYDKLSPNGVYLVEDTHTNYWSEYGGALRKRGTFIEYAKDKIDEINAVHTRGALPPNAFTAATDSMTVYDSVVVFERRPQGQRQAIITQAMTATE